MGTVPLQAAAPLKAICNGYQASTLLFYSKDANLYKTEHNFLAKKPNMNIQKRRNLSMSESTSQLNCVNCGGSEMEVPLITTRYAGEQYLICSRCLPVLIHKPEQLMGTLKGADIPPAPDLH